MKVFAIMTVITLCLVQDSHSFGSQNTFYKLASCKTKPYGTAFKTELMTMKLILKDCKEKLIGTNLSLVADPHLKKSCNIIKATKLEHATKHIEICKKFYFGIQIFLVTAKKFSELTTNNTPEELLQIERDLHKNLECHLNLVTTELLECFTQFKYYNQTKQFDKVREKTEARAQKFSDNCFETYDISHQRSYNNLIYYRELNNFLRIGNNKFRKISRECKNKKQYKYNQARQNRAPQINIRKKDIFN
ncbi:uncharacterized protein [Euwallacea fornicatus]|uniref:uncharacterized protein n=1 Tax=Euwallacea fornicatus TaxID=995702 RepID=UPI00338FDCF9